MMVTANGVVTRLNAGSISRQGRPATGVRAQNLVEGDTVVSVNKIVNPDSDETIIKDNMKAEAVENENVEQTNMFDVSNQTDEK
jgi:DNA gyrase/topoisomerase IV subunit A